MGEANGTNQDFRKKSDAALEALKRRLLDLGDEHGFEVEGSGKGSSCYLRSRRKCAS